MSRATGRFARGIWLWLPPALLLTGASFFLVRSASAGRTLGGTLDRRLTAARAERGAALAEEARFAALVEASRENLAGVERLYRERFSTESNRFTDLVREIKRLAEHAGLDPKDIGYPEETLDGFDLTRGSFVFGVEGSYANLRMFLYLLELSPSFVTVDKIQVGQRSGRGLAVRLQLSTFFAREAPKGTGDGS